MYFSSRRSVAWLAGLVCAIGAAYGQSITGSVNTSVAIDNAWFIYDLNIGTNPGAQIDFLGSFGVGSTPFTVPGQSYTNDVNGPYMFLAEYSVGDGFGLVVGLNGATAASAVGEDFSTVFPGANETIVTNEVLTSDTPDLENFYETYGSKFSTLSQDSTLIQFSNGVNVGGVTINATPEPAPFAALGLGAFGLLLRKRR